MFYIVFCPIQRKCLAQFILYDGANLINKIINSPILCIYLSFYILSFETKNIIQM